MKTLKKLSILLPTTVCAIALSSCNFNNSSKSNENNVILGGEYSLNIVANESGSSLKKFYIENENNITWTLSTNSQTKTIPSWLHITDGLVNWDATNDSIDFLEFKVNAEILDSKDIITTDQCVCAQIDHDDFKSSGFVYIKDIISPPPGLKNMFLQTRVKISFSNYVKDAELTFLNRDKYADISYIDSKDVFLHLYYECVDNAYFFLDVESVSGKHIGFDISISINKEKFAFDWTFIGV